MRVLTWIFPIACLTIFTTSSGLAQGLQMVNGTKLYVAVYGQGEPLVVLHGGPGLNHAYFRPHLNELEKKFKVIYYDQRASGLSAIPSADSIAMRFFVNDLEAIRKEFRIKKLNVLAHSWGAVLAMHYALHYPKNINRIILSNPAMLSRDFDREAARLVKQKTSAADSVTKAQLMASGPMDVKKYEDFFLLSFKASAYDPDHLKKLTLNLPPNFPEANKALFTGFSKDTQQSINLYPELKKISSPVLIIHGEADVIPPASIDLLKNSLRNAGVLVFRQSGHFPFIEETEKYNSTVIAFMRKD